MNQRAKMKSISKFTFTVACLLYILCVPTVQAKKPRPFQCTKTKSESRKNMQAPSSIPPCTHEPITYEDEMETMTSTMTSKTDSVTTVNSATEKTVQFVFTILPVKCRDTVTTKIFVATRYPDENASVEIFSPTFETPRISVFLRKGNGHFLEIPSHILLKPTDIGQKVNKTLVIASDKLIVAYGHQHCTSVSNWRATAFRVRPLSELGNDYWVLTYQSEGVSQVTIVAAEDNTLLNISMPSQLETLFLDLDKHESYVFGGEYDVSGSHIVTDKPVLTMAGNSADKIPRGNVGLDPFVECLSDVTKWGRHFSVVSLMNKSSNYILKIVAAENETTLRWTDGHNVTQIILGMGKFYEHEVILHRNSILEVHSSDPILVAQFSNGLTSSDADESMVLVPPLSHGIEPKVITFPVFSLPPDGENVDSFLTVWVSSDGHYGNLTIDDQQVVWREIGKDSNDSTIAQTYLSVGSHTLSWVGNVSIRAIVSSYHPWISYSYPLT